MESEVTYAPRYSILDAFCGCGGLSLGFGLTRRFDIEVGIDINPEALATFAFNHDNLGRRKPLTIREDIANVDSQALGSHLAQRGVRDIDCLIGGPPCEGFSQNRTVTSNGARTHKFIDDPRNHLFRWFVQLASVLRPKVVLIENVPDLVRHRDGQTREEILTALDVAGYATTVRVLNAADYGVPQMRRRAFFLAQRREDLAKTGIRLKFPTPTHRPYPMLHESLVEDPQWLPGDSGYWVSVREAIGDLPPAAAIDQQESIEAAYSDADLTTYRAMMRSRNGLIRNHVARKLGKGGLDRLLALGPGQTSANLPDNLRPKSFYHYSYTRLVWSEPARTITKFVYHVGSGQFGHPEEDRAITIREAARLQSFPDDFEFVGTGEIRKLSSMVGSAVPPLLAAALARQIAQYLDELHLTAMEPRFRREAKILEGDAVMRRLEKGVWTSESMTEELGQLALFNP